MKFDQQHIEDYVFGRLDEEAQAAFQFALLRDKNLRQEVESLRVLQKMGRAKQRKRRSLLFFSQKTWLRVAAVFIGLVTLAVLIAHFSQQQEPPPFVDDKKQSPIEQQEDVKEQQWVEDKEQISPQNPTPKAPDEGIVNDPTEKKKKPEKAPRQQDSPELWAPGPWVNEIEKKDDPLPDTTSGGYVESPLDSMRREPLDLEEPQLYSNLPPLDDIAQATAPDSFRFHTSYTELAGLFIQMEVVNGDTIYTSYVEGEKPDSVVASELAVERRAFPIKVDLFFRVPHSLYSDEPYLYDSPPANPAQPSDWTPNSVLEKYITAGNQNDSLSVSLDMGGRPMTRDSDGLVAIDFGCDVYGRFGDTVMVKIYSNQAGDFSDKRPLAAVKCEVDARGTNSITGNFKVGLYYVVFEKMDGEILGVNKFHVMEPQPFHYRLIYGGSAEPKQIGTKKEDYAGSEPSERFSPNPELERFIGKEQNSDSQKIEILLFDEYAWNKHDSTAVNICLDVKSPNPWGWHINLYSNDVDEWRNGYPLIQIPLNENFELLPDETNHLFFTFQGNFRPGLYYLVLKDGDKHFSEVLSVGKLVVVDK